VLLLVSELYKRQISLHRRLN